MSEAAPPVTEPEARPRSALWAGLGGGASAFAVVSMICVAIGMIEYAASGGAYRLWTWIKVGFLYVASFCTVSLRADVTGPGGSTAELRYRFPLLVGTALVLWLLARAGRAVMRAKGGRGPTLVGLAAVVMAFALPVFLVTLPATLRFPGALQVDVRAVRWQAALYPVVIGSAGVALGAFLEFRGRLRPGVVAAVEGGARAFALALLFAFIAFLALAVLKPRPTDAYAREMRAEGRTGVLTITHHLLMLPAQSMWTLAPSMGGVTEVSTGPGDVSRVTIGRADLGAGSVVFLDPSRTDPVVPLGGGFYLLLLVPLIACLLGGRHAGGGATAWRERLSAGAGAGGVFAVMVAAGAWASGARVPIPARGWSAVSIGVGMPSTVALAFVWGVALGALGGITSGVVAQTPVPDPG